MATFRVELLAEASCSITVEAEDAEEAIDLAFYEAPYVNITNNFDLGDWMLASDMYPKLFTEEEAVREID